MATIVCAPSHVLEAYVIIQNGVNDQHVRELQCEGRVGDGRADAADQVRGSLACSVHNGTVRAAKGMEKDKLVDDDF